MPIQYIGSASGASSATLPAGWGAGDVALVYAYRDADTTPPTLPAGWQSIATSGSGSQASRTGWRRLQLGDTITGVWTGATALLVLVYRGIGGFIGIGNGSADANSSLSINYPAVATRNSQSWVVGMAGVRLLALQVAPPGMTNRVGALGSIGGAVAHDTNSGVAVWNNASVSLGAVPADWNSRTQEMTFTPSAGDNYVPIRRRRSCHPISFIS